MDDFVRDDFGAVTLSNTPGSGIWEIELGSNNKPKNTQDTDYITEETRKEAIAMYDSIEQYGGFYIARYEAGIDYINSSSTIADKVYSVMGKVPYIEIRLKTSLTNYNGGALQVARSIFTSAQLKQV